MLQIIKLSLICLCIGTLSACSTVKPWERGDLAKPQMQLTQNQLLGVLEDHVYFSKEGASGGYGVAAGGCGCN